MSEQQQEAGRELDALVAEQVMGWELSTVSTLCVEGNHRIWEQRLAVGDRFQRREACETCREWPPHYSTDIVEAWGVWEQLTAAHPDCFYLGRVDAHWSPDPEDRWAIFEDEMYDAPGYYVGGSTAPLAICRAALKVLP